MHEDNPAPDERSLRDIAAWLTTPASCGVFLSAFDLQRIGRTVGIGVTPLNRRFAVEQLFRSASIDESSDPLLDALIAEVRSHRSYYEACASVHLQPWIERSDATVLTLGEMRRTWRQSRSG